MTRLIGGRCTHGNVFSQAVLIALETLLTMAEPAPAFGMMRNNASQSALPVSTKNSLLLNLLLSQYPTPFFEGGYCEEATPVPIPNTAVKLLSADGTAIAGE